MNASVDEEAAKDCLSVWQKLKLMRIRQSVVGYLNEHSHGADNARGEMLRTR